MRFQILCKHQWNKDTMHPNFSKTRKSMQLSFTYLYQTQSNLTFKEKKQNLQKQIDFTNMQTLQNSHKIPQNSKILLHSLHPPKFTQKKKKKLQILSKSTHVSSNFHPFNYIRNSIKTHQIKSKNFVKTQTTERKITKNPKKPNFLKIRLKSKKSDEAFN